jgi:hypothetical protein
MQTDDLLGSTGPVVRCSLASWPVRIVRQRSRTSNVAEIGPKKGTLYKQRQMIYTCMFSVRNQLWECDEVVRRSVKMATKQVRSTT